jgi:hypothetical protein
MSGINLSLLIVSYYMLEKNGNIEHCGNLGFLKK